MEKTRSCPEKKNYRLKVFLPGTHERKERDFARAETEHLPRTNNYAVESRGSRRINLAFVHTGKVAGVRPVYKVTNEEK